MPSGKPDKAKLYYGNAADFAKAILCDSAFSPGGKWEFCAGWKYLFHPDVNPHKCGEYLLDVSYEYRLHFELGTSITTEGSTSTTETTAAEVGGGVKGTEVSVNVKAGKEISQANAKKTGGSTTCAWILTKKSEYRFTCECGKRPTGSTGSGSGGPSSPFPLPDPDQPREIATKDTEKDPQPDSPTTVSDRPKGTEHEQPTKEDKTATVKDRQVADTEEKNTTDDKTRHTDPLQPNTLFVSPGDKLQVRSQTLVDFGLVESGKAESVKVFAVCVDGSREQLPSDENGICTMANVTEKTKRIEFMDILTGTILTAVPLLFLDGGDGRPDRRAPSDPEKDIPDTIGKEAINLKRDRIVAAPVLDDIYPKEFNTTRIGETTFDKAIPLTLKGNNLKDAAVEVRNTSGNLVTHSEPLIVSDRSRIDFVPSEAFYGKPQMLDVTVTTENGSDTQKIETYSLSASTDKETYTRGDEVMLVITYSGCQDAGSSLDATESKHALPRSKQVYLRVSPDPSVKMLTTAGGIPQPNGTILIRVDSNQKQATLTFQTLKTGEIVFSIARQMLGK